MPIGMVEIVLQAMLAVHAVRTGRTQPWLYILFIPGIGPILYVVMELLPGLVGGHTGRKLGDGLVQVIAPGRAYKTLARQVEIAPTVYNKTALADECLRLGRGEEAVGLYESCAQGMHGADPVVRLGLARARTVQGNWPGAVDLLEALQRDSPERMTPDIGLLYAASLNGAGRTADALQALRTLVGTFPGEEARIRYAQLLEQTGDPAAARLQYQETIRRVELQKGPYKRAQREWYDVARRAVAAQA